MILSCGISEDMVMKIIGYAAADLHPALVSVFIEEPTNLEHGGLEQSLPEIATQG